MLGLIEQSANRGFKRGKIEEQAREQWRLAKKLIEKSKKMAERKMKRTAYYAKMDTPFAHLYMASTQNGLCRLEWMRSNEEDFSWLRSHFDDFYEDPLLHEPIINQLKQYFDGRLKRFEVHFD